MWYVIVGVLSAVVLILALRLLLIHKTLSKLEKDLSQIIKEETNILLSVSTSDKKIKKLADSLNAELRELRKERHRFQTGDSELKNAVTNISHDLRTPLTAINGYLDLLEKEEKSEEVERYLSIIRNRTENLKQLTEELFRYSVLTSPEYDAPAETVNVNAVLEESILGFYAALSERGIVPEINIAEEKVIRTVNKAALNRIFSNLIGNALKYSSGDLRITLSAEGTIRFSNAAPELTEVQVRRLFDRFYTVENARKSTGLGLAISKILVKQMHGSITANYENGYLEIQISLPPSP